MSEAATAAAKENVEFCLRCLEAVWHDLQAHHLAHQTFHDTHTLDQAIHTAVAALNQDRNIYPLARRRISA